MRSLGSPDPPQAATDDDIFADRADAGRRLLARLRGTVPAGSLVLAIPRGGVEIGAVLARGLDAELDVVLARKLRAPHQPELAIGAVSEDGIVHLNAFVRGMADVSDAVIEAERRRQLGEIARRRELYRAVRPQAPIAGRCVILTDDGIATGATLIAGLRTVREAAAGWIIVAVPVAAPERLAAIRPLCDRLECLLAPDDFQAIGQFYLRFDQVPDDRVVGLLRECGRPGDASGTAPV
jgi:hypothetical protein